MKKLILFLFALSAITSYAKEKLNIGIMYPGPTSDFGYSYQHAKSIKEAAQKFEDKFELFEVESVSEGPDTARILQKLIKKDTDIIFATSFGFMDATARAAQKHSDIVFEHATGYKKSDNMAIYNARFYEGRYISGIIAGSMTKSNNIGYIASFPIPEVIRGINAFQLGLQETNPNAKINIIWVYSWYDVAKESEAARTLIDNGADILAQHTDSSAPMALAEEKGIYAIGQASDMKQFGPKAHLTSIIDNWTPYYERKLEALLNDNWQTNDMWEGLSSDVVQMAEFSQDIPSETLDLVNSKIAEIKAGTFHPFTGPIKNQAGEIIVEAGQTIADEELLRMNYYIEGISATVPQ